MPDVGEVLCEVWRRGGSADSVHAVMRTRRVRRWAVRTRRGSPARRFIVDQSASADAAETARKVVGSMTRELSGSQQHDLMLLATELVNNAVRHGTRRDEHDIRVEMVLSEDRVRFAVQDRGNGFEVERSRRRGEEQAGGWSLYLVDAIADEWGVEREPTTVWLEVTRTE